jgi:hypothetical protein
MFETIDWMALGWTAAVFLSGYLIGSRRRKDLEPPLDFDVSTISPTARAEIEAALQRGAKIEAIGILREDTGLGLKDSKAVIDRWNSFAPSS